MARFADFGFLACTIFVVFRYRVKFQKVISESTRFGEGSGCLLKTIGIISVWAFSKVYFKVSVFDKEDYYA